MGDFDLNGYLARIGLDQPEKTDAAGLEALHRAHGCSIPYENFDVLLGRSVSLDPGDLFDKIVARRRGGYCFENNELFRTALETIGFSVRRLLARLHVAPFPAARVHEMLLVEIAGEPWLADVGCGSLGLRAPIPLTLDRTFDQEGELFRLVEASPYGTMFQTQLKGEWADIASFDFEHVGQDDLEMSNYYASTNRSLIYSQHRIATLNRPDGRVSLADFKVRETLGGRGESTVLEEGEPYLEALEEIFGIVLGAPYEALGPFPEGAPAAS